MNAVDQVSSILEKKEQERLKKEKAKEEEKIYQQKQKKFLLEHIDKLLDEFNGKFGLERHGNTLYKGDKPIASLHVAWHEYDFQGSDESPVITIEEYSMFWEIHTLEVNYYKTGNNNEPEKFDKYFAEALAMAL